jgi:hypothetical protein
VTYYQEEYVPFSNQPAPSLPESKGNAGADTPWIVLISVISTLAGVALVYFIVRRVHSQGGITFTKQQY